jgi:Spy/CpxP family protein refolding chaperone
MSKILSNIGDVGMMDKKYLKKFITDKMQLFTQQNLIPERKGRATRNEDPKEGDELKSFEDPDKILQKGYATYNIEKYVNALQQYALHLCRKPVGEDVVSCGKCLDPIDGKCEIFMDGEKYKNDLHRVLSLLKEHDKVVRKAYKKNPVSGSSVVSRTTITTPAPAPAPSPAPSPAPDSSLAPSPSLSPSPAPAPAPSTSTSTSTSTSILPAAKAATVADLTPFLPQEKEYVMHIEKEVMEILVKRILSSMENERLKLAQKRYQKMKDAYEDDYMSDDKKDELLEAHEKEYNDLIKGLEFDKESLKLKLSKFKNEIQDFQAFVNSIIKTYNMKDIEEGISKDKV